MSATAKSPGLALLGRLTWMLIGPFALLLMTAIIGAKGGGWWTAADGVFFLALGAMVLGRWLEFRGGSPEKATGEPATPADLRRYVLGAAAVGLGIWVVANLVGNHWLTG